MGLPSSLVNVFYGHVDEDDEGKQVLPGTKESLLSVGGIDGRTPQSNLLSFFVPIFYLSILSKSKCMSISLSVHLYLSLFLFVDLSISNYHNIYPCIKMQVQPGADATTPSPSLASSPSFSPSLTSSWTCRSAYMKLSTLDLHAVFPSYN